MSDDEATTVMSSLLEGWLRWQNLFTPVDTDLDGLNDDVVRNDYVNECDSRIL